MMKTTNPSTKAKLTSKKCTALKPRDKDSISPWVEDYLDMGSLKMKPATEWFIDRLALDLIAWADDESEKSRKQIRINQFIRSKKIGRSTFNLWVDKYPAIKLAKEYAMLAIADKRESGAAVRDYSDSILRMMPMYDPEWKEVEAWKSSLKDQASSGNVTINLPPITTE